MARPVSGENRCSVPECRIGNEWRINVILPQVVGQLDSLRCPADSQLLQPLVIFALEGVQAIIGESDIERFHEFEISAPGEPMYHHPHGSDAWKIHRHAFAGGVVQGKLHAIDGAGVVFMPLGSGCGQALQEIQP